jgi:hypothetical protein
LVLVTGWTVRNFDKPGRTTRVLIAGFLICVVVNNGYSFAATRISSADNKTRVRVAGLRAPLTPGGIAMIVTYQDDLSELINRAPFDNLNRPQPIPLYDVIEPATVRILQWRQQFSAEVFLVWNRGGEVWISKRFWSARPRPDWNWIEGDDRKISWRELPEFFATLQTDADLGGEDGFVRLSKNAGNRELLTPIAARYHPPGSPATQR